MPPNNICSDGSFFTKPLQGSLLGKFRDISMGHSSIKYKEPLEKVTEKQVFLIHSQPTNFQPKQVHFIEDTLELCS